MTDLGAGDESRIERGGGIAVWRQLVGRLSDDIAAGRLATESRLPTEAALAERFNVNRHTVRRAIGALVEEGLVRVEQGRGIFVEDVVIDYPLRRRTSFSANLLEQGREPEHEIIEVDIVHADRQLAEKLRIRQGTKLIRSRTLGLADGIPLSVGESLFPHARFPGLATELERLGSISRALAALGRPDYRRQATNILTRMPTQEEARLLKQPASQPVLITEAIDCDLDDRPIRYGVSCFAGARVQITVGEDID